MQRRILRSAILATCMLIAAGIVAAPALGAAVTLTPVSASAIIANAATLHATVSTSGYAISYEFEYGTTTAYGSITAAGQIPAGETSDVPVSARVTGLQPHTTYHFRLDVDITTSNYLYPLVSGYDEDLSFTTAAPGRVTVTAAKPPVTRGVASIGLNCASTAACVGKYSLSARNGRKSATCASGSLSVGAGKKKTLRAKLAKACLALFRRGKLAVTFTAKLTSGQPNVAARLTL
jgi:hypothetical protein